MRSNGIPARAEVLEDQGQKYQAPLTVVTLRAENVAKNTLNVRIEPADQEVKGQSLLPDWKRTPVRNQGLRLQQNIRGTGDNPSFSIQGLANCSPHRSCPVQSSAAALQSFLKLPLWSNFR